ADGGASPDEGASELALAGDEGARMANVGEDGGRADEDVFFELDAGVQADVVLDAGARADAHAARHEAALAEHGAGANPRAGHDVAEVPDVHAGAELCAGIHHRRRMDADGGVGAHAETLRTAR